MTHRATYRHLGRGNHYRELVALRVALDATPLLGNPTGIGVFTRGLIDGLAQRGGVQVAAFALSARGFLQLGSVLPPNVAHNRLPMPAGLLTASWRQRAFPTIEPWIGPSDIVHGTNFVVPPVKSGTALVTVHDLTAVRFPELCEPASLRYPSLVKVAVNRGAHVHTLSQFVADEVCELLNVPSDRVHVVPPGVREMVTTQTRADRRYVFAIGTVEPRKDYPTLIRAFDKVATQIDDVDLVIAGAAGWGASKTDEALSQATNRERIKLIGRIDDAAYASLLIGASALAYPSIYEGFGFPPIEAMQCGVPVVATNAASIPEVCGDAATLVPSRDSDALAEAIIDVLTNGQRRGEMIDAGKKRAAMFDWATSTQSFVDLYKAIAR
jgi:glycosyltransferase involved in cell wall biosynthesis